MNHRTRRPTALAAAAAVVLLAAALAARAEVRVVVDRNDEDHATAAFAFDHVPPPAKDDAAARATFSVVSGTADPAGGEAGVLHDGRAPAGGDEPAANFFFAPNTDGGRIALDLGAATDVRAVHTYSWHAGPRGPQVYKLYAADGAASDFDAAPKRDVDPAGHGWRLVATVDTRPKREGADPRDFAGQYGVRVDDPAGTLGRYRYFLFDCARTEEQDPFGNTFYSEIDVIARDAPELLAATRPATRPGISVVEAKGAGDVRYRITIDTSDTPDLTAWADAELAPVVREWYPRIVALLPSDQFEAPRACSITFHKDKDGVADTGGTRINCAANWFRKNLKGEARGAVVHELVHVVQQYGRARRRADGGRGTTPGWLVEGIPDYVRWYKYEPTSHGADVGKRSRVNARYDASYRVSANFLNWASETHDKDLVPKLNAALRRGEYDEELWKRLTGKTIQELGDDWKANLGKAQ